ncbi:MAG TPA: hypothetical protein VFQ78_05020 [Candidatus Udaeobacter sp.]|jgi:hypothetical protein|nr:hypothetical protein [Candidatus Udaeobacter sp.]
MIKRLLPLLFCLFCASAIAQSKVPQGEYIIVVGGPSMMEWEKYKAQPHDHWWANFIRAARIRTEQLRTELGPDRLITWLVYKQGYLDRAVQEKQDLISHINSVRDKFHLNLIYFQKGSEVINYINSGKPRGEMKVAGFEFFGHSNKACFMFDYSNILDSASKSWLHESELTKIDRRAFARGAYVKSWGCHTGESMSKKWKAATGVPMWGAIGRTQFMLEELPILSTPGGKWVN